MTLTWLQAIEANGVANNRIQNLAITINKIKYALSRGGTRNGCATEPPVRLLAPRDILAKLWHKCNCEKQSRAKDSPRTLR